MLAGYAVCKDCGNGTLNNLRNTQFKEDGTCLACGSSHVDGKLYFEEDENGDPYSDEDYEKEVGA